MYGAFSRGQQAALEAARPYRIYIEWLGAQSTKEAHAYWRESLRGFREPTRWPCGICDISGDGDRYVERAIVLSREVTNALKSAARSLQLTLNALVQGAWALLLNRQSGQPDVVFGAAFAGRPVDLRGSDSIVGPFVNNVPVRVQVNPEWNSGEFFRRLHARVLELSPFQFTPLLDIQDCSEVPWQYRLFDSLVVFQNYLVDEAARRFGGDIELTEFRGPIHTNYPVLLLAEPADTLGLTLIYDKTRLGQAVIEQWAHDLRSLMERIPALLDRPLRDLQEHLSLPAEIRPLLRKRMSMESQNHVPPQTELEKAIAVVWQRMFGLEQVSVEDNLFDLGGHSLLLVHMHGRLRATLKKEFPLVTLFMCPTIRSLAQHLEQASGPAPKNGAQQRDRARLQRDALTHLRKKLGKR
jgi:hypothetical protein